MNGKQTRQRAITMTKQVNSLIADGSKDLDALSDLLSEIIELQDYASNQEHSYKYEIEYSDENWDEGWRYEKANERLQKTWELLEDYISDVNEILRDRVSRKRDQKICDGWIVA